MSEVDEMEKAWDKNMLLDDLKSQGLPLAEEAIAKVAKTIFAWADKSLTIEGGVVSQLGKPALVAVRGFVVEKIDKIDGHDNQRV